MKSKKTLAVLLAIMMILSSVPMFASAAEKLSWKLVEVWPTISYKTEDGKMYYGQTVGEALELNNDGIVVKDSAGNVVDGEFVFNSLTQIPNYTFKAETQIVKANLKFVPTDTETYTGFTKLFCADVTFEMQKGTAKLVDEVNDPPVTTGTYGSGTPLSEIAITGGAVVNVLSDHKNANNGLTNPIWSWKNPDTVVTESGYYEAYVSSAPSFNEITYSVYVAVEGTNTTVYGAVTTWPTIEYPEWTPGMTVADLTLKGGEATVEGTFAITTDATTKIEPNTDNNITVKFIPADSKVEMTTDTVKTLTIAPTYVPKKITVPENIVITSPYSNGMKGSWVTANAADLGIEPADAKVSFYNTENVDSGYYKQYLYPGEYDAYITVSADYYESATVPVKVIITQGQSDGQPVRGNAESKAQNDGSYIITASVSAYYGAPRNNGTMLIYINGETVGEFPVSTETQKVDYLVTESGDYNVSLGYKAGEGDYYTYTNDEWSSNTFSFDVTMPRDIETDNCEVETGTRTENGKYVVGTTVYMTGKSFDTAKYRYSAWKFYDDDGNEFSPADLTISENGKRITFTVPNHDMKAQFIIEEIPEEERPDTDDGSSLLPDIDDIELPDIGDLELDTEGDHKFNFVNIIQNLIEMLKNFIKQIGQTIEGIL